MKETIITDADINDVPKLYEWGQENWELWGDDETKWFSQKSLADWITNPRDDILLVAKVDGTLAGLCFSNNMRSWAYCAGLFVDKPYRKMGIARKLVNESLRRMSAMGLEENVFLVDERNTEGMKFYQKIQCKTGHRFVWMYKSAPKEGK